MAPGFIEKNVRSIGTILTTAALTDDHPPRNHYTQSNTMQTPRLPIASTAHTEPIPPSLDMTMPPGGAITPTSPAWVPTEFRTIVSAHTKWLPATDPATCYWYTLNLITVQKKSVETQIYVSSL